MLTLRMIGMRDFTVREKDQPIGRIRFASRGDARRLALECTGQYPRPPFGSAQTFDDAKADFKAAWLVFKEQHGPEKLAKAYAEMNLRKT